MKLSLDAVHRLCLHFNQASLHAFDVNGSSLERSFFSPTFCSASISHSHAASSGGRASQHHVSIIILLFMHKCDSPGANGCPANAREWKQRKKESPSGPLQLSSCVAWTLSRAESLHPGWNLCSRPNGRGNQRLLWGDQGLFATSNSRDSSVTVFLLLPTSCFYHLKSPSACQRSKGEVKRVRATDQFCCLLFLSLQERREGVCTETNRRHWNIDVRLQGNRCKLFRLLVSGLTVLFSFKEGVLDCQT